MSVDLSEVNQRTILACLVKVCVWSQGFTSLIISKKLKGLDSYTLVGTQALGDIQSEKVQLIETHYLV